MRLSQGTKTLEWLKAMKANGAKIMAKIPQLLRLWVEGEIGLVNNYYLYRFTKDNPNFPVAHHHTRGDAGALLNVTGLAVLNTTDQK